MTAIFDAIKEVVEVEDKNRINHEEWLALRVGKFTSSQFQKVNFKEIWDIPGGSKKKREDYVSYLEKKGLSIEKLTEEFGRKPIVDFLSNKCMEFPYDSLELSEGGKTYLREIIGEIKTGKRRNSFSNKYTDWGHKYEPVALKEYEKIPSIHEVIPANKRENLGFEEHPEIGDVCGGTPDALVYALISNKITEGRGEVKCHEDVSQHILHMDSELTKYDTPYWNKHRTYWYQMLGHFITSSSAFVDFITYHPDMPKHLQLAVSRIMREDVSDYIDAHNKDLLRFSKMLYKKSEELEGYKISI